MRDIKFRIWDTEEMIYPDQNFNFSNAVFWNIKITGEKTIKVDTLNYQSLMQFTGIKDINKVEIYEGDIVKNGLSGTWIVQPLYKGSMSLLGICQKYKNSNFDISALNSNVEVIGNIHENPELLK